MNVVRLSLKDAFRAIARLGAIVALAFVLAPAAFAGDVTDVRIGEHENHTRLVIETSTPIEFEAFTLSGPADRLVVSLPGSSWNAIALPGRRGEGRGMLGEFRYDSTGREPRLIFDLERPGVIVERKTLAPNGGGHRLVIDIADSDRSAFHRASGFPREGSNRSITQLLAEEGGFAPPSCERIRVVIDPGHGGRDPGAPGRFGGRSEAAVNLAAALTLRDILLASGRYDVIMTRDTNVFLELEERVQIAQTAEADLFISLHADASPSGSRARGASVYTLAEYAEARVRTRARRDGDWMVGDSQRPEYVNNLLLNLAIREKRNQSLVFSEMLLQHAGGVTGLFRDRPFERGLYVLLDSQIPAVLFEMGFLTNPDDSRRLNNASERRRLMQAVAGSIDSYFERCDGAGQSGRLIASNRSAASGAR
ncbi:MAG: N-acetylmuramoyl-L-alanine amidase [Pseudomonadota bacterium]